MRLLHAQKCTERLHKRCPQLRITRIWDGPGGYALILAPESDLRRGTSLHTIGEVDKYLRAQKQPQSKNGRTS